MHIDSVPVYLIQCELPLIDRSTKGAVSTWFWSFNIYLLYY
jgi:hypothetical protein